MIEAIPTNLFSSNFRLEQEKKLVGELDPSVWRCQATLELEEGTYSLSREKFLAGDYLLERNGNVVARATKISMLRDKYAVQFGNRTIELKKLRWTSRRFGLFENDQQIGTIYPRGIFTKRANIDMPGEWPLASRVFMFWLVFLAWKRESQAAS